MILAIANQKGGVGKTTTAVNLAHGLSLTGRAVCLIDLDPQGNCADALGIEPGDDLMTLVMRKVPVERVAHEARPALDIIRADKSTSALKTIVAGMDFRERVLADALADYPYDVIVLDCAPSSDVLHVAALVAADYVLLPTQLQQFSVKGVAEMLRTVNSVRQASRSHVTMAGILPTFYDQVRRETHEQLVHLAQAFGELVWPPIPVDAVVAESHRAGRTLWEMPGGCRALDGIEQRGIRLGGYRQALDRVCSLR
jgi:chromosome partitioning protein